MAHKEGCEFQPKSAEHEQIDCTCGGDEIDPEVQDFLNNHGQGDDACTDENNTNQI